MGQNSGACIGVTNVSLKHWIAVDDNFAGHISISHQFWHVLFERRGKFQKKFKILTNYCVLWTKPTQMCSAGWILLYYFLFIFWMQDNLLDLFYSATSLSWIRNYNAEAVGRGVHLAQIIMWQLEWCVWKKLSLSKNFLQRTRKTGVASQCCLSVCVLSTY